MSLPTIASITGPNGSGKTAYAVTLLERAHNEGQKIFTNMNGLKLPHTKIGNVRDLLKVEDGVLLIDEVSTALSSVGASAHTFLEVTQMVQTMRHRRASLWWTAPTWKRGALMLREVTQVSITVMPVFETRSGDDLWPRTRLSLVSWFDAREVAEDQAPTKKLRRRGGLFRPSKAFELYDTHANASSLTTLHPNACGACGGSLPPVKHSEAVHDHLGVEWEPSIDDVRWRTGGRRPVDNPVDN